MPKARFRSGLRAVGAAGFEPASFPPPAESQSLSMRPGASPASPAFPRLDIPERLDAAGGTKAVPRLRFRAGPGAYDLPMLRHVNLLTWRDGTEQATIDALV